MLVELQARSWAFRFGNPMAQYRTPIRARLQYFPRSQRVSRRGRTLVRAACGTSPGPPVCLSLRSVAAPREV